MSKTLEQMAEEYANTNGSGNETHEEGLREGFIAGYQAAKDQYKEAIDTYNDVAKQMMEEAVRLLPPKDQVADADKVMNSPKKLDGWISVKERLPQFCKTIVVYGPRIYCVISQMMQDEEGYSYVGPYMSVHPDEVTHWCELPEPPEAPKGEG